MTKLGALPYGIEVTNSTNFSRVIHLRRHDFSVSASNVDASIKTSSVMSLHDFPSFDSVGSYSAVVRSLGPRITMLGPAVDLLVVRVK